MKNLCFVLFVSFLVGCSESSDLSTSQTLTQPASSDCPSTTQIVIDQGSLTVGFRGNILDGECDTEFSGITSIQNTGLVGMDPVRDKWTSLNYEHILTGFPDGRAESGFTPRQGLFPAVALEDGTGVRLVRNVEDEPWKVSSVLTYRVVPPHYIDFEFDIEFHDASYFHPHAVFFFANYMRWVEDNEIYFRGYSGPGTPEEWVHSQTNGSSPGDSYIAQSSQGLAYDPSQPFFLVGNNLANEPWPRIAKPFYYGRSDGGAVFAMMFDQLIGDRSEMRFTVMRWSLAERPSPAWDFAWTIYNPQVGQRETLRGRMMFKPFVSTQDVEAEYESWNNSLH